MVARGSMNISSIFLAAVCAVIVAVPKLFTALCNITEPTDTIAYINPIESPVLVRSQSSPLSNTSSDLRKIRKSHFFIA